MARETVNQSTARATWRPGRESQTTGTLRCRFREKNVTWQGGTLLACGRSFITPIELTPISFDTKFNGEQLKPDKSRSESVWKALLSVRLRHTKNMTCGRSQYHIVRANKK